MLQLRNYTSRNISNSVLQGGASLWRYIWGWRVSVFPNSTVTTLLLEVFSQRNFAADFIQLKLTYSKKRKSSLFESPFGRLRGNVRTSSIAHWKARVRLLIRHNWTFFPSSYCRR